MPQPVRTVRFFIILAACFGTFVLAVIVASAFSPSTFRELRTVELLGLVGLLALPFATGLAIISERRARG